jgi:hypothetical protein
MSFGEKHVVIKYVIHDIIAYAIVNLQVAQTDHQRGNHCNISVLVGR